MKEFYLIRHAQSFGNVDLDKLPEGDYGLTTRGKEQSINLIQMLEKNDIKTIIHSPLKRSIETVDYIKTSLKDIEIECWQIQEFCYLPISLEIDKKQRNEMKNKFWNEASANYKINETTESFFDFLHRVETFITKLNSSIKAAPVAIISHKYFIKGVLWYNLVKGQDVYCNPQKFHEFCSCIPLANGAIMSGLTNEKGLYLGEMQFQHLIETR